MAKSKITRPRKATKAPEPPKPTRWTDDEVRTLVEFALLGRELEILRKFGDELLRPPGRWWTLENADVQLAIGGQASGHLKLRLIRAMPQLVALLGRLGRDPHAGAELRALVGPLARQILTMIASLRLGHRRIPDGRREASKYLPPSVVEELARLARRQHWKKFSALAKEKGYPDPDRYLRAQFEFEDRVERKPGGLDAWLRGQLDELSHPEAAVGDDDSKGVKGRQQPRTTKRPAAGAA